METINTNVTSNCQKHKLFVFIFQSSSRRDLQLSVRETLNTKKEDPQKDSAPGNIARLDSSDDDDDDEADFDSKMRMQILKKRKELGDLPPKPKLPKGTSNCLHIYHIFQFLSCQPLI